MSRFARPLKLGIDGVDCSGRKFLFLVLMRGSSAVVGAGGDIIAIGDGCYTSLDTIIHRLVRVLEMAESISMASELHLQGLVIDEGAVRIKVTELVHQARMLEKGCNSGNAEWIGVHTALSTPNGDGEKEGQKGDENQDPLHDTRRHGVDA